MPVIMCRPQFEEPIVALRKIHTVRPIRKRPLKIGDPLSLRVWTGKAYRSPQREFFTATVRRLEPIRIYSCGVVFNFGTHAATWCHEKSRRQRPRLEGFARDDGFGSWEEMREWFTATHGLKDPFDGTLIGWKD